MVATRKQPNRPPSTERRLDCQTRSDSVVPASVRIVSRNSVAQFDAYQGAWASNVIRLAFLLEMSPLGAAATEAFPIQPSE